MSALATIAARLNQSRGMAHKGDIAPVMRALGLSGNDAIPVGDDTAAIPDGDGHLLFAIEGFVEDFIAADPWFAGYCGVMVNVSDVLAMGGRPLAVVDALWSTDAAKAAPLLAGMREAARRYGVPIVGDIPTCGPKTGSWLSPSWAGPKRWSPVLTHGLVIRC
jgi:selenophosphate synthetase-related protein